MLDIGWSEMVVVLVVALVVIGPKDLPRLAREIGRWTSKARGMAREFQRSLDDMAREADLQDLKKGLDSGSSRTSLTDTIRNTIDPDRSIEKAMDVDVGLPSGSVLSPPPPPPTTLPPTPALPPVAETVPPAIADASPAPPEASAPVPASAEPQPANKS